MKCCKAWNRAGGVGKNDTSLRTTRALCCVSGLTLTTILCGVFLASPSTHANSTANASVTVAATCTITTGGGNYSATIAPGTYEEITGNGINISCNDSGGYALYAIGYSGDSYTTPDNNRMLGPNSTYIPTATSGNDSYWAMKVAGSSTTSNIPTIANSFSSYQQVPATYTKVSYYPSATMGTTTNSVTTPTYKINIASTQTVGTYIGKVKYTMVHPNDAPTPVTPLLATDCPANRICYAPNADDIDGSMSSISNTTISKSPTAGVQTTISGNSGTTITSTSTPNLIAPNYSRSGYGFAGWSTDYEATSSSTIFGPNETITLATDGSGDANISTNGLILYPVWIESAGNIQSWTGCSSLTTAPTATKATLSSMTALTDQRDGNVYTVARLADGKCWMTENLRLDATNTLGSTNQALAQGYGDDTANNRGKFIGLADSENANFDNTAPTAANNATNSIYSSDGSTEINIGTANYPYDRIPRYNNNNTNRSLTASYNGTGSSTYYQWYGYGNYYSWPAAIANTTHLLTNNQSVTTTSLCPAGWRLPQGGNKTRIESNNDNDFWTLIVTYLNGGTKPANYDSDYQPYYYGATEGIPVSNLARKFPNNFVYSGLFEISSAAYRSSVASYSSSTADSNYGNYYLYLGGHSVYPGTDHNKKYTGRSVRCIAGS